MGLSGLRDGQLLVHRNLILGLVSLSLLPFLYSLIVFADGQQCCLVLCNAISHLISSSTLHRPLVVVRMLVCMTGAIKWRIHGRLFAVLFFVFLFFLLVQFLLKIG
jgi:hypothetical protein